MKRFLVFLVGFVFLGSMIIAQTPEENFQKAGQTELAKREAVLLQKKMEIEKFFNGMANDGVISGKEMKNLKKLVGKFDKMKKQYNKELEFYNLKIAVQIPRIIRKHLGIYFNERVNKKSLNFGDNPSQDIRYYFTQKTGRDIVVKKSKNYATRIHIGILIGLIIALLILLVGINLNAGEFATIISMISGFILVLIIFLFLA